MYQLKRGLWGGLALALVVLAGCAPKTAPPEAVSYRPSGAPIWSNAQFDQARLVGNWRQSAAFATTGGCAPGGAEIGGQAGALTVNARLCLSGQDVRLTGPLQAIGPGRFRAGGQEWWVIWVDTDYRTLAIGTPSGAFGFILNRGGALPRDRLTAAREIFDFNGYDTRLLQAF
ncbi:MAG: lipocalin family protein [Pseudotabrizicola sp.]|uniref:lipocalin family protein n=1 Tax=Pseudotabrizicola sp. TaxID=2939647 RepID=UPI00271A85FF|nr:lipocalin family protein [Pseudotabrizicola sp.]MDO8883453.1 lipocalin family protein [Pseudotabrizicola sp.]MDP2080461.1 lipocalin family protein [Pseudotabrizicola sp.]MDZ7573694.1 lipocalin family protein [Pseudotabrizicola sp.]